MAAARAKSQWDGQDGSAADTAASTPARGYRPSFRLNQRRVPPRRSSLQDVAVKRIERPAALGRPGRAVGQARRGAERIAQARAGRARALGRRLTNLLADLRCLGVTFLHLLEH